MNGAVDGALERELVAGMQEHVHGMELPPGIATATVARVRRRRRARRAASLAGTLVVATTVATLADLGPLGDLVRHATSSSAASGARPRGDQFLYLHHVGLIGGTGGPYERRTWVSMDGRHGMDSQLRQEGGTWDPLPAGDEPCPAAPTKPGAGPPGGDGPCTTPALQPDLPTTPAAMLSWLYAHDPDEFDVAPRGGVSLPTDVPEPSADTHAWMTAIRLLDGYLPPSSQPALLLAMSRIPGAHLVANQTDAAGRTVLAVTRRSNDNMYENFAYFDPASGGYRGLMTRYGRDVHLLVGSHSLVKSTLIAKAGQMMSSEAVTRVAVVQHLGQLP